MGGAPDIGVPSDGVDLQTQLIGDSVSSSYSVSSESTKTDHVYNLPMLILKSCQSSHALRQAFPVWTSMETSHPFIQLSSCLTTFTQGGRAAERVSNVLRSVPVGTPASYLEQSGMCNYLFAAYTLIPTTILCQWILIAVMRLWFIFNLPRSSWKSVKMCSPVESRVTSRHQSRQRALIFGSGSYLCQEECIPTFENLSYQGVPAFGRWIVRMSGSNSVWMSSVLSVLRRSITFLLHPAWGPNPPKPRELHLCRLPSSIVYLSSICEECKHRVLQPSGSWDSFVISIVILISIGMLVLLSTALGREAFQSAASSVQSMLSPVVPQANDPGTSPELNAADPAVSLQAQAHPESPPPPSSFW